MYASYASHVPIASNILSFSFANGIVFFCQMDKLVMGFGNTFVEEISLSDDEPEPDSMEDAESARSRGVKAPPSYAELSSLFGRLEQYAEPCGIHEAGNYLRKANMRFLAARAAKPARQSDIRSFTRS